MLSDKTNLIESELSSMMYMSSGRFFPAKDSLAHASSNDPSPTDPIGGPSLLMMLASLSGPPFPPPSTEPPVPGVVPMVAPPRPAASGPHPASTHQTHTTPSPKT